MAGTRFQYSTTGVSIQDRSIEKYKTGIVVGGNRHKEAIDFRGTFAPIVKFVSLRILLIIATVDNLGVEQRRHNYCVSVWRATRNRRRAGISGCTSQVGDRYGDNGGVIHISPEGKKNVLN